MTLTSWVAPVVAFGAVLALLGGYLGAVHPVGDSLAAFRTGLALLAAVAGLLAPWRGLRVICAGLAVIALAGRALWLMPAPAPTTTTTTLTLYQKNMLYDNGTPGALAADILESGADVVTVQELRRPGWEMLAQLSGAFPHVARCGDRRPGPVTVLSRWPIAPEGPVCAIREGLIVAPVETPAGRVWIASLHLAWPWPHAGADQARRVAPILAGLDRPVVLGGDFNMVPWSHTMRIIRDALEADRMRPVWPTLHLPGIGAGVPIDHALVPQGSSAEIARRPKYGSDHVGLLVRIALP